MPTYRNWLRNILGITRDEGPEAEEIKALTNQFYVSLHAYLSAIDTQSRPDSDPALKRIRELASKPVEQRTWADAYDLEQQLVLLYDEDTLDTEFGRRLLEARATLAPEVAKWYEDALSDVEKTTKKRALLTRLVNDIQWRYTKDEARRGYTKQITRRTEMVFLATVIVFVATTSVVITRGLATTDLLLMPFVGAAGVFGAAFSMMTSLKGRLGDSTFDDLKLNRSWGLILARVLVGMGASFVVYFFVTSGLLSGDAFPDLVGQSVSSDGPQSELGAITPDFAKLFIWSFLSGFSEKLIPNLLARTEDRLSEPAQLPPQGAHPSPKSGVKVATPSQGQPEPIANKQTAATGS